MRPSQQPSAAGAVASEGISFPLWVGAGATLFALLLAVSALFLIHELIEAHVEQGLLQQARLLASSVEVDPSPSPKRRLETLASLWRRTTLTSPDLHLCVVGRHCAVLLCSSDPGLVGGSMREARLQGFGGGACDIDVLIERGQDYVGPLITADGEEQIAAFVQVEPLGWVVGVHRPHDALRAETVARLTPIALALGAICGLLLPLSLFLIHRAWAGALSRRRSVERSLAMSEERYRLLAEGTPDCIWTADAELRLTYVNGAARKLFGHTPQELSGRPLDGLFSGLGRQAVRDAATSLARAPQTGIGLSIEAEIATGPRSGTPVEIRVHRLAKDAELAYQGTVRDVTGRRQVELEREAMRQRARQSEQLKAIAQLAGGVAHDFNNLMMTILGNAELLAAGTEEGGEDAELIGDIAGAAERAAALTAQLLTFAQHRKSVHSKLAVNRLVKEVAELLGEQRPAGVDLVLELSPGNPKVDGDAEELRSALMSLCANAMEAMPEGGTLTLRTRAMRTAGRSEVEVAVVDTGVGMDHEVLGRIFEPFFTTRPQGQGTGLGLAAVYGCARMHDGTVDVRSVPGEGSTFCLRLPAAGSTEHDGRGEGGREWLETPPEPGRLLVVDDEPLVCGYVAKALGRWGHTVTTCTSGDEAVALVVDSGEVFDLALVDVVMPGMGGVETFRALRRALPDMPVLLTSGYSRGAVIDELMDEGLAGFLNKPLRGDKIAEAVAQVLAESRARSG